MKTLNNTWRRLGGCALLAAISLTSSGVIFAAHCAPPYVQVQDAAASNPSTDPAGVYSIQSVSMGEPRTVPTPSFPNSTPVPQLSCSGKRITAVMKVETLDPGNSGQAVPPPNSYWNVQFTIPASANSTGAEQSLFMEFNTASASTIGTPNGYFTFGHITPNGGGCYECAPGLPCDAYGTVAPDGTITMSIDLTGGYTFGTCTGTGNPDVPITVTAAGWTPGIQLTNIQGRTEVQGQGLLSGGIADLLIITQAQTVGDGVYTIQGNASCATAPVAALAATPTSGPAPLTVNFDASASNVPVGGCGTINTYIFDFGDGNQETKSTPTTSHTYTQGGATYPARVRVRTTFNVTSSNIAQQDITVTSAAPPLLTSIVSRKTHGAASDFDIVLPQPPAQRTIECRTGGINNDYKLVFTFLNNVSSVGNASVTAGAGSVNGSAIGPNPNQYTVNLTGVTSGQSTTVTLTNAADSSGASGNIPAVIGVLVGDTNNDANVNSADIAQTKSRSGTLTSSTNYRSDVNIDGNLNSADIGLVKSKSGTALPPLP